MYAWQAEYHIPRLQRLRRRESWRRSEAAPDKSHLCRPPVHPEHNREGISQRHRDTSLDLVSHCHMQADIKYPSEKGLIPCCIGSPNLLPHKIQSIGKMQFQVLSFLLAMLAARATAFPQTNRGFDCVNRCNAWSDCLDRAAADPSVRWLV